MNQARVANGPSSRHCSCHHFIIKLLQARCVSRFTPQPDDAESDQPLRAVPTRTTAQNRVP